jgi:Fe-S oxidoreductase
MATYKAEFLAQHYANRVHPLPHYLFGFMDRWARLASSAPNIANAALAVPGMEALAKRIADVAPQRSLPRFASRSFLKEQDAPAKNESGQKTVLLWPDTWNNYLQPQVLDAAARVLRSAGFRVVFPRRHICCGRPLYDFGFLDHARSYLDDVLRRLAPQIDAGMPFIVLEPSCASVFLEELRNFYPPTQRHPRAARAQRLAQQTYLLADFLAEHAPRWQPPSLVGQKIVLHGHCHHKSVFNMKAERALLEQTGAQLTMLDAGCCGMAGPFGFERDKYTVSQTLGERVLLPAVRAADHATVLVTDGFSCREQIAQNTSRRAVHVAEVLAP